MQNRVEERSILSGAITFALCAAFANPTLAWGAEARTTTGEGGDDFEEVVVTGTRVAAEGFASPTPLTVIDAAKLEATAPPNVGEVLVRLPGFRDLNSSEQRGRFTGGTQFSIDLRGLGAGRTLLLMDGRRLSSGNTNLIPMSMVQRVDVVTGGASSAYGSDAVAGVVNFIMRDHYDGLKVHAQYGVSEEGDGEEQTFSLLGGSSFMDNRLHVVVGGEYSDAKPLGTIYSRDWAEDDQFLVSFGPNRAPGTPAQGFRSNLTYGSQTPGSLVLSGPLAETAFDADGTPYAFQAGPRYGNLMEGGGTPTLNPGASQFLAQPLERYAVLGRATFDVSDRTSVFVEASHGYQDTYGYITYYQTGRFTVGIDNPFIPAATRGQMQQLGQTSLPLGRVHTDLGDDQGRLQRGSWDSTRYVLGARGRWFDSLDWDAYFQHGESTGLNEVPRDVSPANLLAAFYAVPGPDGTPICGPVATNPNLTDAQRAGVQPGCVPFNPFGVGTRSEEALDYVTHHAWSGTLEKQDVAAFNLRFKPFSTWAGAVSAATGVEARKESVRTSSNPLALVSGNSLFNNIPYRGSHDVKEAYIEGLVPLAADNAWADAVDLNVAARITDYSTSGTVETWKVGMTYATPFDVRLRGTRSRDIAAPSMADLFSAGGLGSVLNGGVNPFNGQTGRVSALTGGNPDLQPEVADTWTAGLVYQPAWLPGFGMSVDYYDIEIADVIATPSASDVLNRCAGGVQAYCDLIVTDSSPFGIAYVRLTAANLAQRRATGTDIELNYRMNADRLISSLPGEFSLRGLASYVKHLRLIDAGGPVERAGSGLGGLPQWSANFDVGYTSERFATTVNVRYFNTLKYDSTLVGPEDAGYDPDAGNSVTTNRFPSRTYTNWSASVNLPTQSATQLQLFVNVSNLFDKDPPRFALPAFFQGGNPYSLKGRFYRAGVRYEF
jgi:outer membrane receptor protein involved in Fe transport